jgi:CRISPR-associated protein Cmr3
VNSRALVIGLQFEPVDTWCLADGMPSGADLSGGYEQRGVFPPHPATVVGVARAALARANGWSGHGAWSGKLVEVLGDGYGPDSLGMLSFDGPYLLRDEIPHHPVPAHLVGSITGPDGPWRVRAALRPGEPVLCDLDDVRLPAAPEPVGVDRPAEPGTQWLSAPDLTRVLERDPAGVTVVARDVLWQEERRVGIARDAETRTVREQMLYTATHVRPGREVSIGIRVSGLPEDWRRPADGELVPFGGEGRLARCRAWDAAWPDTPVSRSSRFTAVALTPIDVGPEVYRGGTALAELGGATVVSACLPRARQIGGWRSIPRSEPSPLHSVLPPGSVLFCEGADLEQLATASPLRIGQRQRWGYGVVALGPWPGDRDGAQ